MSRPLDSQDALAEALRRLAERDARLRDLIASGLRPALRRRPPAFEGLASIVLGQMVSVQSAAAIWGRLQAAFPNLDPEAILAGDEALLRAAGLSRAKIAALRAVASAILAGELRLEVLATQPADDARAALVAVRGIGPWTADLYLLFCLGHADVFPAGDLALQEAARLAFDLPARPDARTLAALAERWSPDRGAAAHLLWELYRTRTRRDVAALPGRPIPAGRP